MLSNFPLFLVLFVLFLFSFFLFLLDILICSGKSSASLFSKNSDFTIFSDILKPSSDDYDDTVNIADMLVLLICFPLDFIYFSYLYTQYLSVNYFFPN